MRKFYNNPEMMINVFDIENVVTASDLTPSAAKDALADSKISLDNKTGENLAQATQIFSFKN